MNDIRNLLPDPKPTDTSDWVVQSSRDVRVQMLDGNRLHLTNNADNADSYVYTQVSLPAGQYRFGVEVSAPQGAAPTKLLRVVVPPRTELTPAIWDGQTGRVVTPPNTLPEDGELEFRVMVGPTTGCAIWVRRLFVMTDDDWQRMLDAGIAWFDGDSRIDTPPPPLSGLPFWLLATIWSWRWSHEPPHHAHKRPASARLQELCDQPQTGFGDRHACGTLHLLGLGCVAGGCANQPLCAGSDRKYTNVAACMGEWIGVGAGRDHAGAIQGRLPIGFSQGRFGPRTISCLLYTSDAADD